MKHLIVGAGASLAEALALGNNPEICPPLIRDFARKTWSNYNPHPILEHYLKKLGYFDFGRDARELFYRLEEEGTTNIEEFMEFAWNNRDRKLKVDKNRLPPGYISGLRILEGGSSVASETHSTQNEFWENFLYHGIGSPISFFQGQCFFENGKGWRDLRLSKLIVNSMKSGDLALNLNYDTVFELALTQINKPFVYSPNEPRANQVIVCKPHGSLNMVINDQGFMFGQPEWLGMPQPKDYRSYSGLIPPRMKKQYKQHRAAKMILMPVLNRNPKIITMWGVGLTDSDIDIIELYKRWSIEANRIEIINPSEEIVEKARSLFHCNVVYFRSVEEWHNALK
jgi:hypothetical protein